MGLFTGAAVVLVLLLVNGGFVYKTSCPLPSGGTQTSWAYAINDLILLSTPAGSRGPPREINGRAVGTQNAA